VESSDTRAENKDLQARKQSPPVGRQAVFSSKGFGDDRVQGRKEKSEREKEREREREKEEERRNEQISMRRKEMRAKEGERGHKRGSGRREEEIVVERQGEEREVGSVTEQDQCTTRTLRVPPPFAHLPLTLTQRRSRRPPRVSFAALAQAARQRRGREEDETGLEDERREGEIGLRGEAQIASCTAPLCQPHRQRITALAHRRRLLICRPMHRRGLLRRPMLFEICRGSKNCIINP